MLSPDEQTRYSRHTLLGEVGLAGQLTLKNSSVLIIGLGGLGCPAAQYLAAAGVGHLGLCDADTVSLSNLQRQILFTTDSVGQPKAEVAATQLRALNPEIQVTPHPQHLTEENKSRLIGAYDLVLDCTDNFPTRFLIAAETTAQQKPLIYGAIHQFEGQLSVFAPHLQTADGQPAPCLRCMIPELPPQGAVPT